MKSAE